MRIYSDFYHSKFNVIDNEEEFSKPIKNKINLKKLKLGWNSCFLNHDFISPIMNKIYTIFNIRNLIRFRHIYKYPSILRDNSIQARFGNNYNKNTIMFQRKLTAEKLSSYVSVNKLKRYGYIQELTKSWSVLSPFGFGEITLKDFKAFIYGCLLLKPNMDHLETWPNFMKEVLHIYLMIGHLKT